MESLVCFIGESSGLDTRLRQRVLQKRQELRKREIVCFRDVQKILGNHLPDSLGEVDMLQERREDAVLFSLDGTIVRSRVNRSKITLLDLVKGSQ